ncbi:MAG: hypothetical protein L0154_24355 [Chloroflexi bacterium]|nr:hypothetical protein [Chloroflexota bacterium]
MSDQRIREVNIKETDEGYIIELKGDKDVLQDLIFSRRGFRGFGKHMHGEHSHHRGEHGRHHGPRHHRGRERSEHHGPRRRFDLGPWFEEESPRGKIIDDDAAI